MKPFLIKNKFIPAGKICLRGDKSIAHRALILSALACAKTTLTNFPVHDDSLASLSALKALGVKILRRDNQAIVFGKGLFGLIKPKKPIYTKESGSTLRMMLGVLAGQCFEVKITCAKGLSVRPMARVNLPLRLMGAKIKARVRGNDEYAPITIRGGKLKGITYYMPIASAQVKSAILFAGLFANGKTQVIEKILTRDHTERMLKSFGADITIKNKKITLNPVKRLSGPKRIYIPGDISSAAFFIVLGLIIPKAKIIIQRAGINPLRSGIINAMKRMGAKIKVAEERSSGFEPMARLTISSSRLRGAVIHATEIPSLIDELPVLMVAAAFAQGRTTIEGCQELRVKETDRINSMVTNLRKMGSDIRTKQAGKEESIIINGKTGLSGADLKSFGDHRTAMSLVVAALAADGPSRIDDISCINKSFPDFLSMLNSLKR